MNKTFEVRARSFVMESLGALREISHELQLMEKSYDSDRLKLSGSNLDAFNNVVMNLLEGIYEKLSNIEAGLHIIDGVTAPSELLRMMLIEVKQKTKQIQGKVSS